MTRTVPTGAQSVELARELYKFVAAQIDAGIDPALLGLGLCGMGAALLRSDSNARLAAATVHSVADDMLNGRLPLLPFEAGYWTGETIQ